MGHNWNSDYNNRFYLTPESIVHEENKMVGRVIQRYSRAGSCCLDYGCGTGFWSRLISEFGQAVYGIDMFVDPEILCETQGQSFKIANADGSALPFRNRVFGLIIALWVFQYIINESFLLQCGSEIRRVIRPTGFLVVANNLDSGEMKRKFVRKTQFGNVFSADASESYFRDSEAPLSHFFSKNSVNHLLSSVGFKKLERAEKGWSYIEVYSPTII